MKINDKVANLLSKTQRAPSCTGYPGVYENLYCPQRESTTLNPYLSNISLHHFHSHSVHCCALYSLRTDLPVHHVMTDSCILTGLTGTLININLTVDAIKPGQTFTWVHADQVMAGSSIVAGAGLTLVYFSFTVDSWWRRRKPTSEEKALGENDELSYLLWLLFTVKRVTFCKSTHQPHCTAQMSSVSILVSRYVTIKACLYILQTNWENDRGMQRCWSNPPTHR